MKTKFFMLIIAAAAMVSANAQEIKAANTQKIKVALACSSACEAFHENTPKMSNDPRRLWGWGEVLELYFDKNVKILNFAKSGRSTVTFRSQGYWKQLLDSKPDYVIMALGANDSKKGPKYTEPQTSYKENLRRFYNEAKAIGAKTIFVTLNQSMSRGADDRPTFNKEGKIMRQDRAPYSQAMREVAKEFNAPCLELFDNQKKEMEKVGVDECRKMYRIYEDTNRYDPSHTNLYGAHFIANIIARELSNADTPLAKHVMKSRLWESKLIPVVKEVKKNGKAPETNAVKNDRKAPGAKEVKKNK